VSLSLQTAAFQKGATLAEKRTAAMQGKFKGLQSTMGGLAGAVGKVAGAFGIALSGGALVAAGARALDYASSLGEVSTQLGVTTHDLQMYRYIASQVGIEQEQMDKGLGFLSRNLGKLAAGAKAPAEALKNLGFNASEISRISKMTAGEAMPLLADAFAKLESPTQRAALAAELFGGKLGPKFLTLLEGGAAGLNQFAESYRKLGIEMSPEQIARADEAADKLSALKQVMEAKFAIFIVDNLPVILKTMDDIAAGSSKLMIWLGKADKATKDFGDSFQSFQQNYDVVALFQKQGAAIGAVATAIHQFGATVRGVMISTYAAVKTWMVDKLNAVWTWVQQKIQGVADKFQWLWDVVVGHSYIPDMVDQIGVHMRRLDAEMVQPAKTATEKTANLVRDLQALLARLYPEAGANNQFLTDLATLDASLKAGKISADEYADSLQRLKTEGMGSMFDEGMSKYLNGNVWDEEGAIGETADPTAELDALMDRLPKLEIAAKRSTGQTALAFAHMAEDIVGSLQNLSQAFKHGGFWDKVMGVLGVVQAGVQAYMGMKGGGGMSFANRAGGGSVIAGRTYMVGERGKELFRPHASGRIVPNNDNHGSIAQIVPSPYFDVVVDGRVVKRAAPMAGAAAVNGAAMAQRDMGRRQRQRIP
jgi:hypothetical protein